MPKRKMSEAGASVSKSCAASARSVRVMRLSTSESAPSAASTEAKTATPPRRGTGALWTRRAPPGWSSHPKRPHARRTSGVSTTDVHVATRKSAKYVFTGELPFWASALSLCGLRRRRAVGMVVAAVMLVVVVVVLLEIDVVEDDAEEARANVLQNLLRAAGECAR